LFFFLPAASSVRSQILDAKTELNLGIAAYQEGKSEEAIQHLEHFVSTDSRPTIGHYYLGVVYDSMCAFPKPCDPRWAARAIQEYSKVLELEPAHKDALKSMAYLLYRIDRLDESESLYRKAVKLDPDDPEALYSTASWTSVAPIECECKKGHAFIWLGSKR
jgi:tetratricopeptide (TPR) repeat protein